MAPPVHCCPGRPGTRPRRLSNRRLVRRARPCRAAQSSCRDTKGPGRPPARVVALPQRTRVPSPFPGMDPYFEHPRLWPGFHAWLMAALAEDLSLRLLPRYFVALEERVYIAPTQELAGIPD